MSWIAHDKRYQKELPFDLEPDVWYTLKLRAENSAGKANLQGKIWKRGEQEPKDWSIELVDLAPNTTGAPGMFGNVSYTVNCSRQCQRHAERRQVMLILIGHGELSHAECKSSGSDLRCFADGNDRRHACFRLPPAPAEAASATPGAPRRTRAGISIPRTK